MNSERNFEARIRELFARLRAEGGEHHDLLRRAAGYTGLSRLVDEGAVQSAASALLACEARLRAHPNADALRVTMNPDDPRAWVAQVETRIRQVALPHHAEKAETAADALGALLNALDDATLDHWSTLRETRSETAGPDQVRVTAQYADGTTRSAVGKSFTSRR